MYLLPRSSEEEVFGPFIPIVFVLLEAARRPFIEPAIQCEDVVVERLIKKRPDVFWCYSVVSDRVAAAFKDEDWFRALDGLACAADRVKFPAFNVELDECDGLHLRNSFIEGDDVNGNLFNVRVGVVIAAPAKPAVSREISSEQKLRFAAFLSDCVLMYRYLRKVLPRFRGKLRQRFKGVMAVLGCNIDYVTQDIPFVRADINAIGVSTQNPGIAPRSSDDQENGAGTKGPYRCKLSAQQSVDSSRR